jgi:hypothetical protein
VITARGVGGHYTATGGIVVTVDFIEDNTGSRLLRRDFTGADVPAVRGLIAAQLQEMAQARNDATLNEAIVGKVLGRI